MRALRAALLVIALLPLDIAAAANARTQGETALRTGELDRAAEHLERAVSESPNDAAAHHLLADVYGRQASGGGMITKMRLVARIREHYEHAVALAPDEIEYRESLLQFYARGARSDGWWAG